MNKKWFLGISVSIVAASVVFIYKTSHVAENTAPTSAGQTTPSVQEHLPPVSKPGNISSSDVQEIENAKSLSFTDGVNEGQNDIGAMQDITSPVSAEVFNRRYISDVDGRELVSRSGLDNVFKTETSRLLEELANVAYSETAEMRKLKLSESISKELKELTIHDQQYECAGRVCLVEITYSDPKGSGDIRKLSSFSKQYTFEKYTKTELGEEKLKGFYIETEDPSQLTLNISQ